MTDFTQAFQNDHNNLYEIGPLLVKLSHLIVQSHITFLMRMEEFILQMCIVVYANVFLLDKTFILLKCAHMCFMHIFLFMRILLFPSSVFLCDILKCG